MNSNIANLLTGATALAAGVVIGYLAFGSKGRPLVVGAPYQDAACNAVAWNSGAGVAYKYSIQFSPVSGGGTPISVTVDFNWLDTPGFHHNVQAPKSTGGNDYFDIDQDPCKSSGNVLTFNLHPVSSIAALADPDHSEVWSWDTSTSPATVTVTGYNLLNSSGVPLNWKGTVAQQ